MQAIKYKINTKHRKRASIKTKSNVNREPQLFAHIYNILLFEWDYYEQQIQTLLQFGRSDRSQYSHVSRDATMKPYISFNMSSFLLYANLSTHFVCNVVKA